MFCTSTVSLHFRWNERLTNSSTCTYTESLYELWEAENHDWLGERNASSLNTCGKGVSGNGPILINKHLIQSFKPFWIIWNSRFRRYWVPFRISVFDFYWHNFYVTCLYLCRLWSIATHRDLFVRRLTVLPCVCLSRSHTFLVVTHSYVSQVTHAFLRMLPLFC